MLRTRIVAAFVLLFTAWGASAHPGHPTLNPHHTHGPFELDPFAALFLALVPMVVYIVARAVRGRRLRELLRLKK